MTMNPTASPLLVPQLTNGPLTLLLGQRALSVFGVEDFFEVLLENRAVKSVDHNRYESWIGASHATDSTLNAWREVGEVVSLSPSLLAVARLRWSAVITSAIDSALRRALTAHIERDLHYVFPRVGAEGFRASHDPLVFASLFGGVDRPSKDEQPPVDKAALAARRGSAAKLLSGITDVVGPRGLLIIEGWSPATDWLRPRDLSHGLFGLQEGQVQLFSCDSSCSEVLKSDEDFASLIADGVIQCHENSFFEYLQSVRSAGRLPASWEIDDNSSSSQLAIRGLAGTVVEVEFPAEVWRRYQREFFLLTDEPWTNGDKRSPQQEYDLFRELLKASQLHKHWLAVRDLAFKRPFLAELHKRAVSALHDKRPQNRVLILEGQAGSGKTVGLAQLALGLRKDGFPVIYVPYGSVEPTADLVDRFCMYVENTVHEANDSTSTALIWDGLRDPSDYLRLSELLAARGRRVLVIGSSYKMPVHVNRKGRQKSTVKGHFDVVTAKITMLQKEQDDLRAHLGQLIPEFEKRLDEEGLSLNSNFLVLLYRLIPEVRGPIDKGLLAELRQTEDRLRIQMDEGLDEALAHHGSWVVSDGVLADAMVRGLAQELPWLLKPLENIANPNERIAKLDEAERLIAIVLCVGQFGIPVPQSLVLRCLSPQNRYGVYRSVMGGDFDVIEDIENIDGTYDLQPRQVLEAQVIVKLRYANPKDQLAILKLLAGGLRDTDMLDEGSPSLNCVVRVLRQLGPAEHHASHSQLSKPEQWPEVADTVRELCKNLEVVHARLLLLETHFRREWVGMRQNVLNLYEPERDDDWKALFEQIRTAEAVIRGAINQVAQEASERPAARRFLSFITNELACVLGTRQKLRLSGARHLDVDDAAETNADLFERAQRTCREARSLWEDNGRVLNSEFWITRDYVLKSNLSEAVRQSLLAELCELYDEAATVEMTPEDAVEMQSKRWELAEMIDLTKADAILAEIAAVSPAAAAVLKVRKLVGGLLPAHIPVDHLDIALTELESLGNALYRDRKATLLYSRVWWRRNAKCDFFEGERLCLPFSLDQWHKLDEIMTARLGLAEDRGRAFALFHRAWARLQLREMSKAQEDFNEISRLGVGGARRALALAIMGDATGKPMTFRGEVRKISHSSRGFAWVPELAIEVAFNPLEMVGSRALKRFDSLGSIQLAVNYRGLYALPVDRFRRDAKTV